MDMKDMSSYKIIIQYNIFTQYTNKLICVDICIVIVYLLYMYSYISYDINYYIN